MEKQTIECLSCGATRSNSHVRDECPRCGYLGWAASESLTETLRGRLREHPLEQRRLPRIAT